MKYPSSLLLLILILASCSTGRAREPILGGPCEGCELVFEGMPPDIGARSRIASPNEPGEPLVIEGTVRASDGTPVAGIIVYAYHTDATGIYPRSSTRHGRLRGWASTDTSGYYRFETIRPGAYPGGGNPQHVHMHVIEPGHGTYWIDDIYFADDPHWIGDARQQVQRGRGGNGLCRPGRDEDGTYHVRRDIELGKNVPGYVPTGVRPEFPPDSGEGG